MVASSLGPGTILPQERCHGGGKRDHPGVLASAGDVIQASTQIGPLGPGPGQCQLSVPQVWDSVRGARQLASPGGGPVLGKLALGDGGGVLVVVQQEIQRSLAVSCTLGGTEILRVPADKVMHAVPAVASLDQQALAM